MPRGALKFWARRAPRAVATVRPTGYFGKVPSHGDFVGNRLDRDFREAIDRWLRGGVRASQEALGGGWLAAFIAAPAWRFALDAGVAGPDPVIGVMTPSVDRVGRYFPLVVAVEPVYAGPLEALRECDAWLDTAERLARTTAGDAFDLRTFDAAAEALAPPVVRDAARPDGPPRSLWWTASGRDVAARGLPAPASFADFIARHDVARDAPRAPGPPPAAAPEPARILALHAAGESHLGIRRQVNADAWYAAADGDVFAVADGLGDDRASAAAALRTVDALREISAPFSLSDLVADVKGRLGTVHARLKAVGDPGAATSVVVLAAKGDRFAVLWAGDCRAYVSSAGTLRPLTQDHVEIGLGHRVSRTVGGAVSLSLQSVDGVLHAGDRFLLCSNALARTMPQADLAALLTGEPPEAAARTLVQDALIGGIADNVTALVVGVARAGSTR